MVLLSSTSAIAKNYGKSTPIQSDRKKRLTLLEEAQFQASGRYYRIYGNHDLEWNYPIQQTLYLKPIFGPKLRVIEGMALTDHLQ